MNRRQFMEMSALALMAGAIPQAANADARRRWGLQLFTVVAPLEQDFEGTLRAVAEIGYREVETIGSFGRDPAYVRGILDKYGLLSPSLSNGAQTGPHIGVEEGPPFRV